ncbi:hypothetical protein PTSG_04028 [Salpingoeca rosetta]|uniref:Uncharacterized protein n=1 Tax=Salpingoeca rosetta (strain ATCC 50818 / BSB-021) TaxID=946362 RepID=F2U7K3_SALR5|nr:uncharacterized protein PTSG_04028 [Salpingoeca rosetta]EGD83420.1 hypothetical protein PTSG_04028 [Salpingoeca rosetta]|eukprot:XP_004994924.1 hypothetical protein PTSG_04028 [Salpingoeca rosetta]
MDRSERLEEEAPIANGVAHHKDENDGTGVPEWVRFEDLKIVQDEKNRMEDNLTLAQEENQRLKHEKEELMHMVAVAEERASELEQENARLHDAVKDLESDLSTVFDQLNNANAGANDSGSGSEPATPSTGDANASMDSSVAQLQDQLRQARDREADLTSKLNAALQTIADMEETHAAAAATHHDTAQDNEDESGSALDERNEETARLVAQLQQQVESLTAEHDEDMRKYATEAQSTIQELQAHVAELNDETVRLSSELSAREKEVAHLRKRAAATASAAAMDTGAPGTPSRPTSADKHRRPWRPPSATGNRADNLDDSREYAKMNRPQLLKTVDHMHEEIQWLNACLTAVREHRRDEHVRLPKRRKEEFVFATESRAKEKELHKNMHIIIDYLQKLDVPPEAPTWRQLVVMYQTCQELTDKVIKTEGELDEAIGELDTLRNVLGVQEGMSSINAARVLISKLNDVEADNDALKEELQHARDVHAHDKTAFDEQLNELDQQLMKQGQEYDETLKMLEVENSQLISDLEHRLAAMTDAKEALHDELDRILRDLERAAGTTPDASTKTKVERCMEHIRGVQASVPRGDAVSTAIPTSSPTRPRSAHSMHTLSPSSSQRLAPARAAINRSPHRAPEVVGAASVIAQARGALGSTSDSSSALTGLKQHMVEQERRHQEELRDLMRHTEELHARQKTRLQELAAAHDASEDSLYKRMLELEVEAENTARQRDEVEAQLRIAEANVARLQAATEDNHGRALELEANFEAEVQGLQEVLQREKEQHEQEVTRLQGMVDSSSEALVRECRALEQQLQRQEETSREKDKEITRLMGEFRNMRDAHEKQYEELEKSHEEEMVGVLRRHEQELQKQGDALQEAYDTVQGLAKREKELSEREKELAAEVDSLQRRLQQEQEQALDERERQQQEHERDVAHLQEMVEAMKTRHAREVEQLQHDIAAAQADTAAQQDRAQAFATALDLKEEELASAREAFEEERKTFKEAGDRLRRNVEQLDAEVSHLKAQHGAESRELSAANTRQSRALEEAQEAKAALELRAQALQRELTSTRAQLESELAREREAHDENVMRERQHRADTEAALQRKVGRLVEERDALKQDVERLTAQLQDTKAASTRLTDETSTEMATLRTRHAAEVEKLEDDLRRSEAERSEFGAELQALRDSVRRYFDEVTRKQPAGDAQAKEPVEQLRTIARTFSDTAQQRDALEARVRELEKAAGDYREQVDQLREDVAAKEEQVSRLQSNERAGKNNAAALETRLSTTTERAEALERENGDLRARITALQEELGDQAAAATANQAQLSAVLDSVKQGFSTEKQNFHKQMEGLRAELYEAQDRISDMRGQLRDTEAVLDRVRGEHAAAAVERDGLKQALQAETSRREKAEEEASYASREVARLNAEVTETTAQARNKQGELDHVSSLLSAVQADLERARDSEDKLKEDVARMRGELEQASGQLTEHEAAQQRHRNTAYEVEVLRREVDEQRRELERAQQQNLQQKAQANREKRNNAAVIADLERQIEVLKARHAKEREALVSMDANLRQLNEDKAKADRETSRQREVSKNLQSQLMQQVSAVREKERQVVTLKKRVAALEDDIAKLQMQKRSLESRTRRDQSRLATDLQRHLEAQDRSMRVLDRARDQSLLMNTTGGGGGGGGSGLHGNTSMTSSGYDPRLSGLGSQVRRLGAQIRQERLEADNSAVFSSTLTKNPSSSHQSATGTPMPAARTNAQSTNADGTLFLNDESQVTDFDVTKEQP